MALKEALTEADMANPPALPSRIPLVSLEFAAHLATPSLEMNTAKALLHFRRAADYIAAGMGSGSFHLAEHFELTRVSSDDLSRR